MKYDLKFFLNREFLGVIDLMNCLRTDFLVCQRSDLYNVSILQKEKVPENPTCKYVSSETIQKHDYHIRLYTILQ